MKKIKDFSQWLNEEAFAQVGVAPEGNLGGTMGNVVPPSANSVGSGDAWPSLGAPATQTSGPSPKSKKKKKSKTRSKFNSYEKAVLKNSLQQESETASIASSIGYPSRVVVSGESIEKHKDEVISAIKGADPKCKGIGDLKEPAFYPATSKVVGVMDSTCLRALSVALRRIDPSLKAEIVKNPLAKK